MTEYIPCSLALSPNSLAIVMPVLLVALPGFTGIAERVMSITRLRLIYARPSPALSPTCLAILR